MSHDSWTCLMVQKGPGIIDDDVRAALKMAACDLYLNKWDRMNIVNDVCNGVIETKWDTHSVGARSGVLFRTQIDSETGNYMVNFLFSTKDLERGADILREMKEQEGSGLAVASGRFPCEALYQFYDLSRPANRRLN